MSFSFFSSPHFHSHHQYTKKFSPFEWRNIIILKYLHTYCLYTSCHKQKERKCIFLRWKCKSFSFFIFCSHVVFMFWMENYSSVSRRKYSKIAYITMSFFILFWKNLIFFRRKQEGASGFRWSLIRYILHHISHHHSQPDTWENLVLLFQAFY